MQNDQMISKKDASLYAKSKIRKNGTAPRISRSIVAVVSAMLLALGWWASVTEIREVARASGEIAPTGALAEVQHATGGVLERVLSRPGEIVEAGDPIATLSPDRLQSEIDQLSIRAQKLRNDVARHNSMLAFLPEDMSLPTGPGTPVDLLHLAGAQRETFMAKRSAQSKRIRQFAEAVRLARIMRDTAEERQMLAQEREEAYQTLFERGVVSQTELEERRQETHRLHSEWLSAEAKLQSEIAQHQDAQSAYEELVLETRETNLDALAVAEAELAQVESQLADSLARIDDLVLRAPVTGVIQNIHRSGAAEVLAPGETLAEILPTDLDLVAEIELSPKDVGHVAPGDPVTVQITSFDQKRFGKLDGTVESISATTEINPQQQPFFRVRVALAATSMGRGTDRRPLHAGMEAHAEILTSSRTVAEYLLKPIDSTLSRALTER